MNERDLPWWMVLVATGSRQCRPCPSLSLIYYKTHPLDLSSLRLTGSLTFQQSESERERERGLTWIRAKTVFLLMCVSPISPLSHTQHKLDQQNCKQSANTRSFTLAGRLTLTKQNTRGYFWTQHIPWHQHTHT